MTSNRKIRKIYGNDLESLLSGARNSFPHVSCPFTHHVVKRLQNGGQVSCPDHTHCRQRNTSGLPPDVINACLANELLRLDFAHLVTFNELLLSLNIQSSTHTLHTTQTHIHTTHTAHKHTLHIHTTHTAHKHTLHIHTPHTHAYYTHTHTHTHHTHTNTTHRYEEK